MTAPAREDLVQEVERPEPRPARRPPCKEIPDQDCDDRPACKDCPARLPLVFGRWP